MSTSQQPVTAGFDSVFERSAKSRNQQLAEENKALRAENERLRSLANESMERQMVKDVRPALRLVIDYLDSVEEIVPGCEVTGSTHFPKYGMARQLEEVLRQTGGEG